MVAAGAAEPVRAAGATGLGVGRFGAGAERDGDLADRTAGVFEVQQLLGGSPDAVAAPVELQAVTGSMASPTVNFFRAKLT